MSGHKGKDKGKGKTPYEISQELQSGKISLPSGVPGDVTLFSPFERFDDGKLEAKRIGKLIEVAGKSIDIKETDREKTDAWFRAIDKDTQELLNEGDGGAKKGGDAKKGGGAKKGVDAKKGGGAKKEDAAKKGHGGA